MGLPPAIGGLSLLLAIGAGGAWRAQPAAEPRVFTAPQAEAGRTLYLDHCAACHADDLGGRDDAPALTGDAFMATWGPRTTTALYDFVRTTMPPDGGSLTPDNYLAIVAYALQQNGAVAGSTPLAADTAAPISAVAPGRRPPVR